MKETNINDVINAVDTIREYCFSMLRCVQCVLYNEEKLMCRLREDCPEEWEPFDE